MKVLAAFVVWGAAVATAVSLDGWPRFAAVVPVVLATTVYLVLDAQREVDA